MRKRKILFIFISYIYLLNINKVFAAETIDEISVCENPGFLRVMFLIKIGINVLQIIVPVVLIVYGSIDLSKSVTSSDESIQKQSLKLFGKRIVYAILFFAVPWMIGVLMVYLGNLTGGVNFTDCLENANQDRIKQLQVVYDELLAAEQEKRANELDENAEKNKNEIEENSKKRSRTPGKSNNFDSSVVENLASFCGSEVGYGSDDYWGGLLVQAAVFMNNYDYQKSYSGVDINTPITTESMCKVFSVNYGSAYLYTPAYCNYTFDKLGARLGGVTDHQRELMTKAAELVLSKEFTIPKNVISANALSGEAGNFYISKSGQKFGTTGSPLESTDVYGNTVSTDRDWYVKRMDELYKKYFK